MMGDPVAWSREFRTLVMAIRGPLDEELADRGSLSVARRERLRTLQRNVTRMFELANTVFDALFELAQVDADRRARAELVDLTANTLVIPTLRDVDPRQPGALEALDGSDDGAPATELELASSELARADVGSVRS